MSQFMIFRLSIYVLFPALLLLLPACQQQTTTNGPETTADRSATRPRAPMGLLPTARPPVPDLPIPMGFSMVESISRSYESAGARFIDHSFAGSEDKIDVDRFYMHLMPKYGWTLRGRRLVRGTYIHMYEKKDEFCEVAISDRGGLTSSTMITFTVQTLGRGENSAYRDLPRTDDAQ